ncbi:MAG: Rpn family recombination-promoting nuclease/putative transposase [Deltaproteobacteria bacterium]|nr:Rpn family recombination-promoting nuclease/putative transposase [Deltaproteobacteria bacterium]
MADEIEHPHDRLFRAVFSDAAEAAGLLQAAVPRELRENVDWDSLWLVEGTFVDDDLRQSESDLLFEADYGKATNRLRLYLLFEHQSTPDVWMRYRLLKYCCRIWDADLRDDPRRKELRPVVPLVFYQGARGWQHSTEFADLFPSAARDWPWVPRFEHVLLDQTRLDPADVKGATMGRIVQLLMMAAFGRHAGAALETAAKLAASLVSVGTVDYIRIIAVYLFSMPDKAAADAFDEALRRHRGGQGGGIMSYAQELLEEGRAEGKEEGREEGRAEGKAEGKEEGLQRGKVEAVEGFLRIGVSWDVITSATGIDEARLRALKERLAASA